MSLTDLLRKSSENGLPLESAGQRSQENVLERLTDMSAVVSSVFVISFTFKQTI